LINTSNEAQTKTLVTNFSNDQKTITDILYGTVVHVYSHVMFQM